jgi:large repetitive protein
MKIKSSLILVSAIFILLLSSFAVLYPTGAPAGYTGSPFDGKNCTQCHGGTATTSTGWITSNIPAGGYVAGQTYQITATNSITGTGKFGFEVSPQNATGTLLGTLAAGSGSQLVGSNKYVTHSNASSSLSSWTFNWTAPSAGTGNVTFYGAFARRHPGPTVLSTLVVTEQTAALPGPAGPITGPLSVCKNNSETYSVGTITGATSYVWSVPTGASITSGQGTTSIVANFGSSAVSGNVSVHGTNAAGSGTASNLTVTVNSAPSQPGAITGSGSPCQGSSQVYSVTNTSGVTYTWTVPAGWAISAGQGTNSVTVTIGTNNGNVDVTPSNACGNGTAQLKFITAMPAPGVTAAVSGPDVVNLNTVTTSQYSTTGASDATSYQWELTPVTSGSISGNGITATVTWNTGYLGTAQIRAMGVNACGNGQWSAVKSTEVINTTGIAEPGSESALKIYPSPSSGSFTVDLSGIKGIAKFRLLDTSGHELYNTNLPGEEATKLEYPLSPGLYLVLVDDGNKILRQKLLIQ